MKEWEGLPPPLSDWRELRRAVQTQRSAPQYFWAGADHLLPEHDAHNGTDVRRVAPLCSTHPAAKSRPRNIQILSAAVAMVTPEPGYTSF